MGAHAAGAGGKLQEERQPNKEEVALKKGALMPDIFGHDEMSIPKKMFGCPCWGGWQSVGSTNEGVQPMD